LKDLCCRAASVAAVRISFLGDAKFWVPSNGGAGISEELRKGGFIKFALLFVRSYNLIKSFAFLGSLGNNSKFIHAAYDILFGQTWAKCDTGGWFVMNICLSKILRL
jgi:hypothetical protein